MNKKHFFIHFNNKFSLGVFGLSDIDLLII
jgi:hypothetical protein